MCIKQLQWHRNMYITPIVLQFENIFGCGERNQRCLALLGTMPKEGVPPYHSP